MDQKWVIFNSAWKERETTWSLNSIIFLQFYGKLRTISWYVPTKRKTIAYIYWTQILPLGIKIQSLYSTTPLRIYYSTRHSRPFTNFYAQATYILLVTLHFNKAMLIILFLYKEFLHSSPVSAFAEVNSIYWENFHKCSFLAFKKFKNYQLSKEAFVQEDMQMTHKCMRRCSTLLVFREMKTKTTRYHYIPTRWAIINKRGNNKCWWGCRKPEAFVCCWWECKMAQSL